MTSFHILGAGGHAKVCAEISRITVPWRQPIVLLSEGLPVFDEASDVVQDVFVAIGDNAKRMGLIHEVRALGFRVVPLVAERAYLAPSAYIGGGSVLMAGAVVHTAALLGRGCIVNTNASVDHDCALADGVHISPGAQLGGGVSVGARTWIGLGASVKHGLTIGADVIVGAGAVVLQDIPDGVTVVGNPAKRRL